ncbi:tetratricopeptide repeat-containing sensor histidine kinase [Algoriphagus antarcticus]|uniref:Tetratricopeptide repeat protein n=1 Tax=Algoriphagus antarcticus TaxID=238540 RepID=A0A3E0E775_9BACT|nr:tetratricopeptide repeat protein [Algoriphagus antarcticus]REG92846.1 tetratricopeptide repeat protein [Algoriphagus antarcticus]
MKNSIKKKLLCFLILISSIFTEAYAQGSDKIDSLRKALFETKFDTNRVKIYHLLSKHLSRNDNQPLLARPYADSAYALSKKIGYIDGVGLSYLRYGNIEKVSGNHQLALQYLDSALTYFTPLGDSSHVADALYDLAAINRNMGNYEKCLPYYFRVLKISEMENNQLSTASTLTSIGIVYRLLKQYDSSIENYKRALVILDSLGNLTRMATCLNGLGGVYGDMKDYNQSKQYFIRALRINQELGNDRESAFQLANLGHIENDLGNYQQALDYQLKTLAIREKIPRKDDLAKSYRNVGEAYFKVNMPSKARQYLLKGLDLSKEINSMPISRDIYAILKDISAAENDFKTAYNYQTLFMQAKDSVMNEESIKHIDELQAQYESEKKDQAIVLLAQEKALNQQEVQRQITIKRAFLGGFILVSLVAFLVIYILRNRLKNQERLASKNKEIQEIDFKRQLTELEMKALQAQINPHFIFNCLNSINQLILDGDKKNASRYLTKFSRLIRMILENAESSEVSLKNELQLLESYIQLESLRFGGKIKYQLNLMNDIDLDNTYLPCMLLQPFIENAIWHGLMNRQSNAEGLISISLKQKVDQLICQIEDNGVGRQKAFELKKSSVWKSKSLGLQLTEERLRLMSKEFKKQLIKISDLKDKAGEALGTRVTVIIPIS